MIKNPIHKWVIAKGDSVSDDIQQKSKSLMNFVVFTKHWKPKYDHTSAKELPIRIGL